MKITIDSSYGLSSLLTFLEEVTEKSSPTLSLEGVEIRGVGNGIRTGTVDLQGWLLR